MPEGKSHGVSPQMPLPVAGGVKDSGRDIEGVYARARSTGVGDGDHVRSPRDQDPGYTPRTSPSLNPIPSSLYGSRDTNTHVAEGSRRQNDARGSAHQQSSSTAYTSITKYAHKENEVGARSRSRSPSESSREEIVRSYTPRSRESDHLSSYEMALRMAHSSDGPRPSISPRTSTSNLGCYISLGGGGGGGGGGKCAQDEGRDKYASRTSNTSARSHSQSRSPSSSPSIIDQDVARRPPPHDDRKVTHDYVRRSSFDHLAPSHQDVGTRARSISRERTNTDAPQEHATLDWRVTRTPEADGHGPIKLHSSMDAPLDYHQPQPKASRFDASSKSDDNDVDFAIRNPANERMRIIRSQSPEHGAQATGYATHAYATPCTSVSARAHDDNHARHDSVTSNMVAASSPAYLGHSHHAASTSQTPWQNKTPSMLQGPGASGDQFPSSGNRGWADGRQQPLSAMMTLALSARVHLNLGLSMPRGLAAVMIQVPRRGHALPPLAPFTLHTCADLS
jgi:hypothetical protein